MTDMKAIRIIPFSGKAEDWNRWSKTFLATATAKGHREVLRPTDPTTLADAALNVQVYNDLILSCQDDITFGIVDESISTDFRDGDARLAWKNLQEKFEPSTGAAKVQLKQEFHQLKLSSVDEDPDAWITQLELKRRRLKTLGAAIDEDDLILHILNHLPKEYETVVELCEEDLSRGNINLNTVKERIRARFTRLQKLMDDPDEAVALMMKSQFKGACTVCGKIGHKGTDCFTLEKNKAKKEAYYKKMDENRKKNKNNKGKWRPKGHQQDSNKKKDDPSKTVYNEEMVLMANSMIKFEKGTWVADSGASTHMCNSLDGMFDLEDANLSISVGDGRNMSTLKVGKFKGDIVDSEGHAKTITLTNVSYVPDLMVNLFSLTAAIEKNCSVSGSKEGIEIRKGKWTMKFDTKFGTPHGHVFGTRINPMKGNETAFLANTKVNKNYMKVHQLLGHPGRDKLMGTCDRMNWKLTAETTSTCEDCMIGKARRMNLNKESKNRSTTPGERIMIDISSVKSKDKQKIGRFWLLVVDEATDMKWSYFLASKKQQVSVLVGFIKKLKEIGQPVRFIRCDNAGENLSLKKQLDSEGSNIRFEFTARHTPQQNGKVERAFATLYGRMRAMMISAGLDESSRHKLWMEAAATATKLDNILHNKGEQSPYKKFYNEDPAYEKHLRTFGEVGVVALYPGESIKAKLDDRGIKCMFLGYAASHAGNVYRMWNLRTKQVIVTRDIKWLGTFHNKPATKSIYQEDPDDDFETYEPTEVPQNIREAQQEQEQEENAPVQEPIIQPVNAPRPNRLNRELQALQPFNKPGRLELEGETNQFCFFVPEGENCEDDTPATFQQAWHHPDPNKRLQWRDAIRLEFKQMLKNKVWRKKGIDYLPQNRKGIGTKWVFKQKKNGIYRARLVVKGYDQIAGVDFQYNFAPVTSEVTLRIMLILWLLEDYFAEVADVQTAFLHGDLEEELFIKIPDGYKEFLAETHESIETKYLQLEKSTYGLVQAARSWWKKFTTVLKEKLKFQQHENDSCLLKRIDGTGKVFLIVYVDDCFVVGDKVAVKRALDEIQGVFNITRSDNIEDFIGCNIKRDGNKILLSQPDLIKKMIEKFESKIKGMKEYETPAPASSHVVRCTEEEVGLSEEEQQNFRSGVGSLLYLLKHSRPELSNSVRELSKVMDRANKAHEKALHRVIRFVQQTQERCLVLAPVKEKLTWELKGYCDSDFAGDTDTRRSVSGFVIYLCGAVIAWRSKGQKSVSLSSTEAEYVAISEVAMEILYVAGILQFLGVPLTYPITVNVDNIGAVYLSKNATTGSRTKHIDTRYHFVREYIEDGIVKVQFVRSEDNHADIFTKNLNTETFGRHCDAIGMCDQNDVSTPKMRNRKGVELG